MNATQLTALATNWAALGYQVNIHAIGDRANRLAIDALTAALRQQCPSSSSSGDKLAACQRTHRFRIEHAQILDPSDQTRLRALGIVPSIQPTHATSDMAYAESRLGPRRIAQSAYRMASLASSSWPPIVLGSDFPVEPPDPWQGMYAAVKRKSPRTGRGKDGALNGWHTKEALSLDAALRGFTTGPAYGAFLEGKAGVIESGAWADWVVLDTPIDEVGVEDLRGVRVRETWVAGRRVYRRPEAG